MGRELYYADEIDDKYLEDDDAPTKVDIYYCKEYVSKQFIIDEIEKLIKEKESDLFRCIGLLAYIGEKHMGQYISYE